MTEYLLPNNFLCTLEFYDKNFFFKKKISTFLIFCEYSVKTDFVEKSLEFYDRKLIV